MNNPCISIIVPCYKVEQYLDRCLKSLVNQTIKDIEIILVDDGSPDEVPHMCDEWASRDERIKVIHKKNGGLGFARNSGLDIAIGEYVAFVDSDDYIDTAMYDTLYNVVKKHNADVVFCGFKTEQADGRWIESIEKKTEISLQGEEVISYLLDMIACAPGVRVERKHAMSVWHAIYKRSIIENYNIRFYSEREVVSEDLPFHVDFLMHTKHIVNIPNSFYYYCLNSSSLTANYKPEKYERFKFLYTILNTKLKKNPDAILRNDRFFIGYTRLHIQHLLKMKTNDEKKLLKAIVDDNIWNELRRRYKPSYLPLYPRIFYWLQIHKLLTLLKLFTIIILLIKKSRKMK